MYVSIRTYRVGKGSLDELMHRVGRDLAIVDFVPETGFIAYQVARTGDRTVASITVFHERDQAERSNELAAEWVAELAGRFRRRAHGRHGRRGDGESRDRGSAGARTPLTAPTAARSAKEPSCPMTSRPSRPRGCSRRLPTASPCASLPQRAALRAGRAAIGDAEAMLGAIDLVASRTVRSCAT